MAANDASNSSIDIINIVLGAGGVGFIYACAKVFTAWREGTWRRNDSLLADLEKWRRDTDDEREWQALQHSWWRQWAGRLEYVITTQLGYRALPPREPYPKKPSDERTDKPRGEDP